MLDFGQLKVWVCTVCGVWCCSPGSCEACPTYAYLTTPYTHTCQEFGTPKDLLDDPSSQFTSMVAETGSDNAEVLRRRANGQPVGEELMARIRAASVAENVDPEAVAAVAVASADASVAQDQATLKQARLSQGMAEGGGEKSPSPLSRWAKIKKIHSGLGGPGLKEALVGQSSGADQHHAVTSLEVPLNPTPDLV